MKELFVLECRRFGLPALIYALLHLAVLAATSNMIDLLHMGWQLQMVVLGVHMAGVLLLSAAQFVPYRKPERWLWLMHRPLARGRIFAALALASGALIALAIGLPALLAVTAFDQFSAHTVDLRHYLLAPQMMMIGATAWLTGAYVALNRSLTGVVIIALPAVLLGHHASGLILLTTSVVCLAILLAITYSAFKPDRRAPPGGLAMLVAAIPLQLGFYMILTWLAAFLFQNGMIALGVHPLHSKLPPRDGYIQATSSSGRDAMLHGLAGATDPRSALWQQQLAQLDTVRFEPTVRQYPMRHQLTNLDELRIFDEKRRVEWTFSHDAMRFHGRSMHDGSDAGWTGLRGVGDTTPFPAVPLLRGTSWIMLPHALYAWDAETGTIQHLLRLDAIETIAREPQQIGDLLYVMTNLRLISLARPVESSGATMLNQRLSIQWPHAFSDLDRVDIADLLDGTMVSASFGRKLQQGGLDATQTMFFVDAAGTARLVAQRRLGRDFPALFEHLDWWMSPVLHTVTALPDALIDKGLLRDKNMERVQNRFTAWHPKSAWLAALAASLLASVAAWNWLGVARVSAGRRAVWITACLVMGPATLGTMMLLQARRPAPRIAEAQTRLMGRDSSIADISPLV